VYSINSPLSEIAPVATCSILLLIMFSTIYLRRLILSYSQTKLPHCFTEFKLYEEQQENTTSQALYSYIMSNAFEQSNDPDFIALCKRYIRWGQLFILFFVAAIVDIGSIYYLL